MLDLIGTQIVQFSHTQAQFILQTVLVSCQNSSFVYSISQLQSTTTSNCSFFLLYLFELTLYVPVNSNSHVGTLPPFNGTFTQH